MQSTDDFDEALTNWDKNDQDDHKEDNYEDIQWDKPEEPEQD